MGVLRTALEVDPDVDVIGHQYAVVAVHAQPALVVGEAVGGEFTEKAPGVDGAVAGRHDDGVAVQGLLLTGGQRTQQDAYAVR
ncbi:hypothetical protein GCM10010272_15250 [Streptomyces lateritius]|nr:hypothetical protein GCM10010272_15250 [Streptomyces lateritius]